MEDGNSGSASGSGQLISSRQTIVLPLPPSCAEFCPAHPDYFLTGTYDLEKSENIPEVDSGDDDDGNDEAVVAARTPQSRRGSIIVCRLVDGRITIVQTLSQASAVLDIHFQPPGNGREDICAAASSTGTISIFRCDGELNPTCPLSLVRVLDSLVPDDVLITSCAWHPSIPDFLAFTTSRGMVQLLKLGDDDEGWTSPLVLQHSPLEAWAVSFSPRLSRQPGSETASHLFTVYSGGDDSSLRYCSWSDSADYASAYLPTKIDAHDAGVVAILPLDLLTEDGSALVVTGSYDDKIRVFAIKPLHETGGRREYTELADKDLGGGVWRLKLVDIVTTSYHDGSDSKTAAAAAAVVVVRLLASCMHAGARIVELAGTNGLTSWEIRVLGRFEEHKSMNYASDFWPHDGDKPPSEGKKTITCVSTSFYDKLLCLWEVQL